MAIVAAEAGGMSEPQTQRVDAAPSESVSGTPSSSASPSSGLDHSYSNYSWQNPRQEERIIPFDEVVRKAKTAGLFPNDIEIFPGVLIEDLNRAFQENMVIQEAVSEPGSQENGFIAIEKVNSSGIVDNEPLAANLNKDSEPMAVPDEQSSVADVAETVSNIANSGATWNWKEDSMDAPKMLEVYTKIAESKFPEAVSESSSKENGFMAIEKLKSSEIVDIESLVANLYAYDFILLMASSSQPAAEASSSQPAVAALTSKSVGTNTGAHASTSLSACAGASTKQSADTCASEETKKRRKNPIDSELFFPLVVTEEMVKTRHLSLQIKICRRMMWKHIPAKPRWKIYGLDGAGREKWWTIQSEETGFTNKVFIKFTAGWDSFMSDNNIQEHDVITFKKRQTDEANFNAHVHRWDRAAHDYGKATLCHQCRPNV